MTRVPDIDALVKAGEATPVPTKKRLLLIAAAALDEHPERLYAPIDRLEDMSDEDLALATTDDTPFERVVDALKKADVEVEPNLKSAIGALDIDTQIVHQWFCICNHRVISGKQAAACVRELAKFY